MTEPSAWTTSDKQIQPPKSWDWYIDGARWLVAIMAGAMAYGVSILKERPPAIVVTWLWVVATLLSLAIAVNVYQLWWMTGYAALREKNDPKDDARREKTINRILWLHPLALGLSALGMIGFVVFGAVTIAARPSDSFTALATLSPNSTAVVQQGDRWLTVHMAADGNLTWRQVPNPPRAGRQGCH